MRDAIAVPVDLRLHGEIPVRGSLRVPLSTLYEGRFGRMLRRLSPAPLLDLGQLRALAERMVDDQAPSGWGGTPEPRDNPDIPAGYTYLGQFIDHDITFDPSSSLQRQNDIDALHDFRSPRFDLDSLYGSGPADEPFQYVRGTRGLRLLTGPNRDGVEDLPRNSEDVALLGDPRNDENTIVGQLQLLFLKFHNRVGERVGVDAGVPEESKFEEAQRLVRWHYQWIVVFDYLARTIGEETFADLVELDDEGRIANLKQRHYRARNNAYMPVEFSVAAFRFGHSQIRGVYDLNPGVTGRPIFTPGPMSDPLADLRGFRPLPPGWTVDWSLFFPIDGSTPQPSRLIDSRLVPALASLPTVEGEASLAMRNLLRGQALGLPSGQDVAKAMKIEPLSGAELDAPEPTPLWFYILKEAELMAGGRRLGPTGGRIVGEVLLGLLELDPHSWYNIDRTWRPTLSDGSDWDMPALARFATGA